MSQPHVVIVGGGFGGLACAKKLAGADVRITLIDRRNHHLFQPLLYQVATAALAPSDIAEPLRGILARQRNVEVRLAEVVGIDASAQQLTLSDGETVDWDYLVLAAGARTSWFGNDWSEDAPGLKTLSDALSLRRRLLSAFEQAEWTDDPEERRRLLTFAVVGAGPTGVEVAGAIAEIAHTTLRGDFRHIEAERARVLLVEAAPDVLGTFDPSLRAKAAKQLTDLGVELRTGQKVEQVEDGVLTVDGERIEAAAIVWAAGVRGSPLGAQLGLPTDRAGRVVVEADCSAPGHPNLFVVGDLANYGHQGERPLPGVAPVALSMGQYVAKAIRADLARRDRPRFHYVDKGSLATIGYNRAVLQVRGLKMSGYFAWLGWVFVHLMTLVGHRNRVVVFVKWAWAWWTADRSSRLLWIDGEDAGDDRMDATQSLERKRA